MTHPRFTHVNMQDFRRDFLAAGRYVAERQDELSSDDIWKAMPSMTMQDWAPDSGTVGALMQSLRKAGLIVPTDRSVISRRTAGAGRRITIWRSTVHASQRLIAKGQGVLV